MLNPISGKSLPKWLAAAAIPAMLLAAPSFAQNLSNPNDPNNPDNITDKKKAAPFPLHLSLNMSTSAGSGWLVADKYSRSPSLSQSISPLLLLNVPKFGQSWMPTMLLSTTTNVSIEWMDSFNWTTVNSRQPRVSDWTTRLVFPGLYREEVTGLSFSGVTQVRLPLSVRSRMLNVLGAFGAGGAFVWTSGTLGKALDFPEWLGTFNASLAPSFLVFAHGQSNPSIPCSGGNELTAGFVPRGDPIETAANLPAVIPRKGEILDNGQCIIPGRRIWGQAVGAGSVGWALGSHTVSASLAVFYQFLSPNQTDDPSLSSPYASGQDFGMPFTSGSVSYTYFVPMDALSLPIKTNLALTAGISSFQLAWNAKGDAIRFPWWDIPYWDSDITQGNNWSSAFISANLNI